MRPRPSYEPIRNLMSVDPAPDRIPLSTAVKPSFARLWQQPNQTPGGRRRAWKGRTRSALAAAPDSKQKAAAMLTAACLTKAPDLQLRRLLRLPHLLRHLQTRLKY